MPQQAEPVILSPFTPTRRAAAIRPRLTMLDQWLTHAHSVLFAPQCLLCGASADRALELCKDCHAELPWQHHGCIYCGLTLPPDTQTSRCNDCLLEPRFDSAIAAFEYHAPIDWLITRLKFHSRFSHARLLGTLLARRVAATHQPRPDYMVPVPLHPRRYRERGYNQAHMLARQLSRQLDIPIRSNVVRRKRHTSPQLSLPAEQRKHNMRQAFTARSSCRHDHVAIVDDVVTTGHTAAALAQALRQGGATSVQLWCVARA